MDRACELVTNDGVAGNERRNSTPERRLRHFQLPSTWLLYRNVGFFGVDFSINEVRSHSVLSVWHFTEQ